MQLHREWGLSRLGYGELIDTGIHGQIGLQTGKKDGNQGYLKVKKCGASSGNREDLVWLRHRLVSQMEVLSETRAVPSKV